MEPSPMNDDDMLSQVCLVIDMEGYHRRSDFIPRELGWCNHDNTDCNSIHYFPWWPYSYLSDKDQRTARYVRRHVHGLSYYPDTRDGCHLYTQLEHDLEAVYRRNRTSERRYIAYKGGRFEKDLLYELGLPSFNLEEVGCPKFDRMTRLRSIASCGQHRDPLNHHCPKVECYHFVQWMRCRQHLPYDQRYVNTNRANRLLSSTGRALDF